jgi:hypothetical protein
MYRTLANDPQVQIAADTVEEIQAGKDPKTYTASNKTDIATSLNPYVMIFDADGTLITSSATLDDNDPSVPVDALKHADDDTQHHLTWEPKDDVRSAIVIQKYTFNDTTGYVVAGRSLRETEDRIELLMKEIALGWAITMIASFVTVLILKACCRKKKQMCYSTEKKADGHVTTGVQSSSAKAMADKQLDSTEKPDTTVS